jgi:eukaryotic-like serine/threonine-protein kinase
MLFALAQWRQAETARRTAEAQRARAEGAQRSEANQRAITDRQRSIADEQRDEALRDRRLAEERLTDLLDLADRTLFDVHDAIAALPGSVEARRHLIHTTLDYLQRLEQRHGVDDRMSMTLSAAYLKLAEIQCNLSAPSLQDFAGAERSYRQAASLIAAPFTQEKEDPEIALRWLTIQAGLTDLLSRTNRLPEAIAAYRRLMRVAHWLGRRRPFDEAASKQEDALHSAFSRALRNTGRLDEALEQANQAIALETEMVKHFPDKPAFRIELSAAYSMAAGATDMARLPATTSDRSHCAKGFSRIDRRTGPCAATCWCLTATTPACSACPGGPIWVGPRRRVYCQKSVALARELADADPNNATAQFDWGVALARLGMVDPEPGGIAESLRSLQEGAAKMEPVAHANPKAASIAAQLSLAYEFMGHRYESLGQNAEAEARYRQSLAAVKPFSSPTGSAFCTLQAIESEEDLALYFARTGDRAAASDFGRRAVREADVFAAGDLKSERRKASAGKAAFVMADVSHTLGDEEQARQSAQRSLSIFETVHDATLLDWNQSVISSARKLSEKAFQ